MADVKISGLPASTVPLAGTEVLPIVQSGVTKQVANNDLRPKQIQSNATSGVLQVTGPASAATRVMTTPDANFTVARIDAAQSFAGNQTLTDGNLVIGTSGKGIDFSATPGTGTSELFADYEEGTWTPSLGGNTTYITQTGQYTKVGNVVYIKIVLVINAIGTGSTTVISGLPYINKSGGTGSLSVSSFFQSATSVISFFPNIANGGTTISIGSLAAAGTTEASNAIFKDATQFQISGCYNV